MIDTSRFSSARAKKKREKEDMRKVFSSRTMAAVAQRREEGPGLKAINRSQIAGDQTGDSRAKMSRLHRKLRIPPLRGGSIGRAL